MLKTRIVALVTIVNFISDNLFLGITPCYHYYSTHETPLIMASGDEIYEDVDETLPNYDPDDNNNAVALSPW